MSYNNSTLKWSGVKEVLGKKLIETLSNASITLPVFLENTIGDTPNSSRSGYIEFIVQQAGSVKDGLGSYDKTGVAAVEVYTPLGSGYKLSDQVYDAVLDSFGDAQWLDNVLSIISVTPEQDGKQGSLYHTTIFIDFRYHYKTPNQENLNYG